jgi:hypothetical protein
MKLVRVALGIIGAEQSLPLHHVAATAVLLDQLGHVVAALAPASPALDVQHVQLAGDIAEGRYVRDG